MPPHDALTPKEKELVAVGAAIAASCQTCTAYHFKAARDSGATEGEMRWAVGMALRLRDNSAKFMADLAAKLLDTPQEPASPRRSEGALLGELISAGAALAVNCVASLEVHLAAAKRLGATDRQMEATLRMARMCKRVAVEKAEAVAASFLAANEAASVEASHDDDECGCLESEADEESELPEPAPSDDRAAADRAKGRPQLICSGVWGGIRNKDQDISAGKTMASLYSSACCGGKGGDIYYFGVCKDGEITRVAIADVVGHGQAVSDVSQYIYDSLKTHMCDPDSGAICRK